MHLVAVSNRMCRRANLLAHLLHFLRELLLVFKKQASNLVICPYSHPIRNLLLIVNYLFICVDQRMSPPAYEILGCPKKSFFLSY